MARDRWQRVEELFCGALEMPGEARTAFLIQACGDDRELLLEVRELLSAHDAAEGEETEDFLEAAVDGEVDRLVAGRDRQPEGRRIGAYRILRTLGEGGMSTVYLATRADREFRQWVAVKVIKRGLDSDEIQHRFQRERQILASSSHPNIARLLDGGTTEDGRPYFVLEFIDGQPI
ncbi:MAG: protein kinase, partial [Acidobacteriota bacterium]